MGIGQNLPDQAVRDGVIAFRAGTARLVGGPGSGKSRLLRQRTEALIEGGCPADDILFITFTRRAVSSLRDDLTGLDQPPEVSTLHSFCLTELRRAAGDLYVGMEVLDNLAEALLFKPLTCAALGMLPGTLNKSMLAFQNSWYDPDLDVPDRRQAFDAFLERIKRAFNVALRGELAVRYRDFAREGGEPPDIRHLVVDEYQDLNRAECEVIDFISRQSESVLVAGDDDQAIYEFKGGRPDLFRAFVDSHQPCLDFVLSACMRYGSPIGDRLSQLMGHDGGDRIEKPMQYLSPIGCVAPSVPGCKSSKKQLEQLIATLTGWKEEAEAARGCEGNAFMPRRALVLLAWKGAAKEVTTALEEAGLVASSVIDMQEGDEDVRCEMLALRGLCRILMTQNDLAIHGLDLWAWSQCWSRVGPTSILKLMAEAQDARQTGRVAFADLLTCTVRKVRDAASALQELRQAGITLPETCPMVWLTQISPKITGTGSFTSSPAASRNLVRTRHWTISGNFLAVASTSKPMGLSRACETTSRRCTSTS